MSTTAAGFKQDFLDRLFGRVAGRYDLVNAVQSFGTDAALRRGAAAYAGGGLILDAGAGSGDVARACLRAGAVRVVCLDRSVAMLARARAKLAPFGGRALFVIGDVRRLPFKEDVFDGAVSGFVFRNLPLDPSWLTDVNRVMKVGGVFASVDLFAPPAGVWGILYGFYLRYTLPLWGRFLAGDAAAYRYLVGSVNRCFTAAAFAACLEEAGFVSPVLQKKLGGVAYVVAARAR